MIYLSHKQVWCNKCYGSTVRCVRRKTTGNGGWGNESFKEGSTEEATTSELGFGSQGEQFQKQESIRSLKKGPCFHLPHSTPPLQLSSAYSKSSVDTRWMGVERHSDREYSTEEDNVTFFPLFWSYLLENPQIFWSNNGTLCFFAVLL